MVPCDFNGEVEPVIHPYKSVAELDSVEPHKYQELQVRGWQDSSKKVQDTFLVSIFREGNKTSWRLPSSPRISKRCCDRKI